MLGLLIKLCTQTNGTQWAEYMGCHKMMTIVGNMPSTVRQDDGKDFDEMLKLFYSN